MRTIPTLEMRCKKEYGINVKDYLKKAKKSGMTLPECAKKLRCSYSYIHLIADNNGIKFTHGSTTKSKRK